MICRIALAALAALAGCDRILGIEELRLEDAGPPPRLQLGGVVRGTQAGGPPSPVAGVMLTFFEPPDAPRVSTISSPAGTFELVVPTQGPLLEGFLATPFSTGPLQRTVHHLRRPVISDPSLVVEMFDTQTVVQLASLYGVTQDPGSTAVFVRAVDALGAPAPGVALQVAPAGLPVRYDDPGGMPSPIATATAPNGRAFVFNVPTSTNLSLSGVRLGSSFGPVGPLRTEPTTFYFVTLNSLDSAD